MAVEPVDVAERHFDHVSIFCPMTRAPREIHRHDLSPIGHTSHIAYSGGIADTMECLESLHEEPRNRNYD